MANLLFYDKPVALNKVQHKNLKIKPMANDFSFARNTNSVILAGVEFTEASKEYPIVFAKAGDNVVPVALLGLRNNNNLFIKEDGHWDARYVPAFVRRYPFVLGETGEQGQRVVCIDEGFPGLNEKDGEPLFEDGEPTRTLKQAMEFLEEYQRQYLRTETFVKRLQDNDLLMSLNAKIDMVDGQQYGLSGLLAIDEKKLLALPDDKALELFKSGELAWVYCHLASLGCMAAMVDRVANASQLEVDKQAKEEAGKPAAKAKETAKSKK
ncbi:MAG: SapC family protein [Pseudomonadales bacterium]